MPPIYIDNNATTRIAPEVFEAMLPYLTEFYGNPSSIHRVGARAAVAMKESREKVAAFFNCREAEVTFTGSGTESNNTAIRGVLDASPDKRHIITSTTEHPSVLELCRILEKQNYRVTYLAVDEAGLLDLDELREVVNEDTALVSLMWANNETGVLFPMEEIVQIVKPYGVPIHVDAVQAIGKVRVDLDVTAIDLLSASAHKVHGPKGVGLLYIRRGTRLNPLLIGGGQEKGRRSGTENVAGIVGFAKALEMADDFLKDGVETMRRLRNRLESGILATVPNASRNGALELRTPNTASLNFENVEGEAVLLLLDEIGVCASSGSACSTGALEPSHVLKAMGVAAERAHGSIRFSLSRYTTIDEIERVLEELPPIIFRLTKLSAAG